MYTIGLLTPMQQDFHQSGYCGGDDPHQNHHGLPARSFLLQNETNSSATRAK
jgi:hypothetical protein